ncbi:MAG: DUF4293 family protein [Chloroherpetonaceae bacterium]
MFFRLQSLYLLLALLCALFNMNFYPFWRYDFLAPDGSAISEPMWLYGLSIFGRSGEVSLVFYAFNIALCLSGVLALVSLFLFKNRKRQALLCYVGTLVSFIAVACALLASFALKSKLGNDAVESTPELGFYALAFMPILFFVAARAISKDEEIATAYQRL